jgi:DNA-binding PadR family transcriptional regulator
MKQDFLSLLMESKALNSKVFSLTRIQLLASLAVLPYEGATFRELKASLEMDDGVLYANLNVLMEMRYLRSKKVRVEKKELESYIITPEGIEEWNRVKDWLRRFLAYKGVES